MRTVAWEGFVQECQRRGYEYVMFAQPCPIEVVQGRADVHHSGGTSSSGALHVGEEKEVTRDEVDVLHGGEEEQ